MLCSAQGPALSRQAENGGMRRPMPSGERRTAMICQDQPRVRFVHLADPAGSGAAPVRGARRQSAGQARGSGGALRRREQIQASGIRARVAARARRGYARSPMPPISPISCRDIAAVAARCGMTAVLLIPGTRHPAARRRRATGCFSTFSARMCASSRRVSTGRRSWPRRKRCATSSPAPDAAQPSSTATLNYGIDATRRPMSTRPRSCIASSPARPALHSVFIAVGAGMTAAGLALGLKHLGSPMRVMGVCISQPGGGDRAGDRTARRTRGREAGPCHASSRRRPDADR